MSIRDSAVLAALALWVPAVAEAQQEAPSAPAPHCVPQRANLEGRASPYDSVSVTVGDALVRVCYGRPSARGRTMLGGEHVPYGRIWRTGANEPTTLHVTAPVTLAGIALAPGSYSLYTIPEEDEWTVLVNASTDQWGHERFYEGVSERDIGRAAVAAERLDEHVETFTIRAEARAEGAADLFLEWERTRVRIPLARLEG